MSKRVGKSPTLLQTLLNRPSQSYSFPQVDQTDYYSSKNDMMKVALEAESSGVQVPFEYRAHGLEPATLRSTASISLSEVNDQNRIAVERLHSKQHPRSSSPPEVILTEGLDSRLNSDEDGDSDNDVFYTPDTSPRTSFASTVTITMTSRPPASPTFQPSKMSNLAPPTRRQGRTTYSISSTSADSTSVDGHSVFSSYDSSSGSTGITTPEPSIHSSSRGKVKEKVNSREMMMNVMGEDWAKDVRWLVPPPLTASSSSTSKRKAVSNVQTIPRVSQRFSGVNKIHQTMAAVIEEDEGINNHIDSPSTTRTTSNITSPKRRSSKIASPTSAFPAKPRLIRRKSRSLEDLATLAEDEVSSSTSTSHTVPFSHTPSLPSYGTPGFTSLTLPRAPPPSSGFLESRKVGKVDLTRSGLAQTTMASVEVTRGLSSLGPSKRFSWLSKDKNPGKGKGRLESAFSFTSYRKPPTHVPDDHVLVQIWAVGIDGVDASICGISECEDVSEHERRTASESGHGVRSDAKIKRSWSLRRNRSTSTSVITSPFKPKQPEVGFVPGRSFVGRVMEVRDEDEGMRIIRKGDWVVGLLDVRKCGALQEFIVVDRHRLHPIPHPALPPSALVDPISTLPPRPRSFSPSSSKSDHKPHDSRYPVYTPTPMPLSPDNPRSTLKTQLTLEELALLPACGLQAYRAVRTFFNAAGRGKKVKGRILVLRGHDSVGAMATQMLVRRGWGVCVHASLQYGRDERQEEEEMRAIQERVRSWGADEVIFDDNPVEAIQQLVEEKEVFDGILDTVGGKEVWEVGKKLLSITSFGCLDNTVKQFTTLFGDFPMRPIPSASDHLKASLRCMKGGDGSGSSRVVYTWVSIDQDIDFEGGDVSVGIGRVLAECTSVGDLRPFVGCSGRIVTFERADGVFRGPGRLAGGGTVVVRVVL